MDSTISVNEEDIQHALNAYLQRTREDRPCSVPKIAEEFQVSASRLYRRIKGTPARTNKNHSNKLLDTEQEKGLHDWVNEMAEKGTPPTPMMIGNAAQDILNKSHTDPAKPPPTISKQWRHRFVQRHQQYKRQKRFVEGLGRSGVYFGPLTNDEDYNEPSPRRVELLGRMNEILDSKFVPTSFWAVLMFADLEMLEKFVQESERSSLTLDFCVHACAAIPLMWMQKEYSSRPGRVANLAKKRDGNACVIQRYGTIRLAHIYPDHLLSGRKVKFLRTFPPFWDMLRYFWTPDRVSRWHNEIFRDPDNPEKPINSVSNMICLDPTIHALWTSGRVAFRPLEYNEEKTTLEIEWHWQPREIASQHNSTFLSEYHSA